MGRLRRAIHSWYSVSARSNLIHCRRRENSLLPSIDYFHVQNLKIVKRRTFLSLPKLLPFSKIITTPNSESFPHDRNTSYISKYETRKEAKETSGLNHDFRELPFNSAKGGVKSSTYNPKNSLPHSKTEENGKSYSNNTTKTTTNRIGSYRTYRIQKVLPISPQLMYDVVVDVNQYRKFLPYCEESLVLRKKHKKEMDPGKKKKKKDQFFLFVVIEISVINFFPL